MKFKGENANFHSIIRYHILLNVVFCIALIGSIGLNFSLYQGLSISIPPDLRAGALVKPGVKQPENVFAFTTSVFMSLNSWGENGQKDYPENIKKLLAFITPNFRNELIDDMNKKNKAGELDGITRQLSLPAEYVFDRDTVTVINSDLWVVKLPLEVKEYVDGQLIKDIEVLYSFSVKRMRTNVAKNAEQIGIDSFYQLPIRTKDFLSDDVVKQDVRGLLNAM